MERMDDWDEDDGVVGLGNFFSPMSLPRRSLRRNRRHLGSASSDLHELMSIIASATDDLTPVLLDDELSPIASPAKERRCLSSLLDLSAKTVAKNCTCELLESHQPPLDESLLRKVAFWSFPQDEKQVKAFANLTDKFNCWERGCNFVRDGRIREMWQVGFMATAYITKYATSTAPEDGSSDVRVSLTFEQQKIVSSTCSECKNDVWCAHIIAAIVYRIKYPSDVRVHAPMTETLSTLDRNQLQKLVQYAINEDPAGILGKVFKHVDAVRDTTSEMNVIEGAPDPTFGGNQECQSQWQLSLQWVRKNLENELDDMTRQRMYEYTSSSAYYPDSYDWSEKIDSRMYNYISKVLDLARQKETISASEVLIKIMRTVLERTDQVSKFDCPCLTRFSHDLIHIFTILLLDPNIDKRAKKMLLSSASEFNQRKAVLDHNIGNSVWAELPSIKEYFKDQMSEKAENEGELFIEPLAAELVSPWPQDLNDLMAGFIPVDFSTYDEEVVIMLMRLETLFHLENHDAFPKIGRLCCKIIRKLTSLAQEMSVVGVYLSKHNDPSTRLHFADVLSSGGTLRPIITTKPSPAVKGKSTRRSNNSKQQPPAKRQKTSHPPATSDKNIPLSQGQLVYSMLYSLHMLQVSQKVTKSEYEDPNLLAGFCLLALELSRFRTVANKDDVKLSEHNWLLKLENMVCDYLRVHVKHTAHAIDLYLDAMKHVGCAYYDGAFPLVLVEMLLEFSKNSQLASLKTRRLGDIVDLCAKVLLDSYNTLEKFTLPTSSPFDIFIDTISDSSIDRRRHRDFAVRKLRVVAETFFSLTDMDDNNHVQLIIKVLKHFCNIESAVLLKMLTKDVRLQLVKLERVPKVLEATLAFAIHSYKNTDNLYLLRYSSESRKQDRDFIFSIARKIGVNSLQLFCGKWQTIFTCDDIRELIMMLEHKIKDSAKLSRDVIKLIMQYYDAMNFHGEKACDLLSFFKYDDKHYKEAKAKILSHAEHFHVNALFELAQNQLAHKKKNQDSMDADTFALVEKALENLSRKDVNPHTYEHLDWMFKCCTKGVTSVSHLPKTSMFHKMVSLLSKHSQMNPDVLLRVLQNMEKTPSLMKGAAPIAKTLVGAYQNYFDRRYSECTHAAYAAIINEMHRARLHCKQYLKGGDDMFDEEVVAFVKRIHSGKKKLIKMLIQEFPSK